MYVSNLNKNINIYFSFSHTTVINLHIYSKKAMLIFLIKKKHNKKDKITVICSNFKKSWFQNISFFNTHIYMVFYLIFFFFIYFKLENKNNFVVFFI